MSRRPIGRPKTRWEDDVLEDINSINISNWKKVAQNTGTTVAQWLRCCATIRKFAGSIPASVSGFFIDIKSF